MATFLGIGSSAAEQLCDMANFVKPNPNLFVGLFFPKGVEINGMEISVIQTFEKCFEIL